MVFILAACKCTSLTLKKNFLYIFIVDSRSYLISTFQQSTISSNLMTCTYNMYTCIICSQNVLLYAAEGGSSSNLLFMMYRIYQMYVRGLFLYVGIHPGREILLSVAGDKEFEMLDIVYHEGIMR